MARTLDFFLTNRVLVDFGKYDVGTNWMLESDVLVELDCVNELLVVLSFWTLLLL